MRFFNQIIFPILLTTPAVFASPVPNGEAILKDKRSFVERDGTNYTVFEHADTGAKIEFVTNSGICETTPGVNQYSGYLSVGTNMNMYLSPQLIGFPMLTEAGGFGSSKLEVVPPQLPLPPGSMVVQVVAA